MSHYVWPKATDKEQKNDLAIIAFGSVYKIREKQDIMKQDKMKQDKMKLNKSGQPQRKGAYKN